MTELWYYTSSGKQMEPVTVTELEHLARSGFLRPGDLVWREGMPKWVAAGTLPVLFPEGSTLTQPYVSPNVYEVKTSEALPDPIVFEDDDEPRPRRRPAEGSRRSRREAPRGEEEPAVQGVSGLKLGLIVGGVGFVAMAILGVALYFLLRPGPINKISEYEADLRPLGSHVREFTFKQGTLYEITVTSAKNTDVDLYVNNTFDETVAKDDSFGPRSFLRWSPQTTGSYRVEVFNQDRAIANRSTVLVRSIGTSRTPMNNLIPQKRIRLQGQF